MPRLGAQELTYDRPDILRKSKNNNPRLSARMEREFLYIHS